MKKTLILIALVIVAVSAAFAQAPQFFNYQGVARSTSGAPLVSQPIGLRITIHDGSTSGTSVYEETFSVTTNSYGLYNVSIGGGTMVSGTFAGINWSTGNKFMEVEIDPAGGSAYVMVGTNELLSVPYSMFATNANNATTAASATSLTGTIAMGGDVTGTNAAAVVSQLQGQPVSTLTPTSGQVLTWNSGTSMWAPTTPASGGTVSGTTNYISKFTGSSAVGNSLLFDNGAQVGLNTTTPTTMSKLEVSGIGTYGVAPYYHAGIVADGSATSTDGTGVYGESGWRGVYGRNPGTAAGVEAMGVLGRCEGSAYTSTGYGVKGEMAGTGGTNNYGVFGTASGSGNGVGGQATGTGAAGIFDGGASGYGLIVKAGAVGINTVSPTTMAKMEVVGLGAYGALPYYQAGIVADGSATTANGSGVYGESGWRGVYGRNPGTGTGVQAIGVHGRCEGSTYTGGGYGVLAEAVGTGPTNYGIYASASGGGTNYAGYFSGNVHITGSISKGSGTFMIDHPLDPENKYLYHSFVESPDMMNVYNGNATTDADGNATITLPDYFDALNKDYRYQLTAIGQPAQVYVATEISGNQFTVKSDKPNVKVSWQVTGVRQDKYANAHRVVPEVEKEARYKGYYLHAAEWGQPDSKSIDALANPPATNGNVAATTK